MTTTTVTLNPFDELVQVVSEIRTDLQASLPAASLARDYHLPVQAWATPDRRITALQAELHQVWEEAQRNGLDRNHRFNAAWSRALTFARTEGIVSIVAD